MHRGMFAMIVSVCVLMMMMTILYRAEIPAKFQLLLLILLFVFVVVYHSRLVEVTSRLDFLWKKQAECELSDMKEYRAHNSHLLRNILPDHVASHFLRSDNRDVSL